jgi:membrane protease YdiL (CAAX protease family)
LREVTLDLLAWSIVAVLGGLAVMALCRKLPGKPFFPAQRPGPIPWTGSEVVLSFFALLLWPLLFHVLLAGKPGPDAAQDSSSLLDSALAFPFVLGTIGLLLYLAHVAHGYPFRRTLVRFFLRNFRANVGAGYLVWLIVCPVVLLVNTASVLVYTALTGEAPREHPLVRALHQEPGLVPWILVFLNAVVLAPILEEVLFRGVLQSWMSRAGRSVDAVAGLAVLVASLDVQKQGFGPAIFTIALLPGYLTADYWARPWLPRPGAGRAVYGSALLFAAFHSSNWPAPVPLFLLGIGLGCLAYRTQSLIGPIFMHGLFNAVACVLLLLSHETAPVPGKGRGVTSADRGPASVWTSSIVPGSWLPRRM